jgi:hypothetical protein
MRFPSQLKGFACRGSIREGSGESVFDKGREGGSLGYCAAFRLGEKGVIDVECGSHA